MGYRGYLPFSLILINITPKACFYFATYYYILAYLEAHVKDIYFLGIIYFKTSLLKSLLNSGLLLKHLLLAATQ